MRVNEELIVFFFFYSHCSTFVGIKLLTYSNTVHPCTSPPQVVRLESVASQVSLKPSSLKFRCVPTLNLGLWFLNGYCCSYSDPFHRTQVCGRPIMHLLDTPGVLPPKIESVETGMKLALCGNFVVIIDLESFMLH